MHSSSVLDIIGAPDWVKKVTAKFCKYYRRLYRNLGNRYVAVVEKEIDNNINYLESINIWG